MGKATTKPAEESPATVAEAKAKPKPAAAKPKPAMAKPAKPPAAAAKARVAAKPQAADRAPSLKLKDLVERVSEATGAKKKATKAAVEATLTEIGAAIARGEELLLPGVGKVRVAKSASKAGTSITTLKVRSIGKAAGKEGLADPAEAD